MDFNLLPQHCSNACSNDAFVLEHESLGRSLYRLKLENSLLAERVRAGQFVHLLPRPVCSTSPLLRRAFSVMEAGDDAITVVYRAFGRGTSLMSQWQRGQKIDVLGPLGQPYPAPTHEPLLVGGGVGTPPLVMFASQIRAYNSPKRIYALFGASTATEIIGKTELEAQNVSLEVATEDGSAGHHGYVTELLRNYLAAGKEPYSIYACGPLPMLRAVSRVCEQYNTRALLSLEENMPCGFGVCNGCAVPVKRGSGYEQYMRICVDGPGVWSDQIDWDKLRL